MTKGKITNIIANLITIKVDGPVFQNEICYVIREDSKLRSEVIKVEGDTAFAQVFEPTTGIGVGAEVEFSGHMLEIELGPGILSQNFDGLQNNLDGLEDTFLIPGVIAPALDESKKYLFKPIAKKGQSVKAGDWLGSVQENNIDHDKIKEDLHEILNGIANDYVYLKDKKVDLNCIKQYYTKQIENMIIKELFV